MYLPSFVTGHLLKHVGAAIMLLAGSSLLTAGVAMLFAGEARWVYFCGLVCIGVGWNFCYVSTSGLILTTVALSEKALGQGLFDVFTLGGLSVAMVSSGFTYAGIGWRNMISVRCLSNRFGVAVGYSGKSDADAFNSWCVSIHTLSQTCGTRCSTCNGPAHS